MKIKIGSGLNQLRLQAKYMLDDMFRLPRPLGINSAAWAPSIDLYESPGTVYMVADAAGVERQSMEITIEGGLLRLAGRRCSPVNLKGKYYHLMEIEYGPFERLVRLPHNVDLDRIEAHYRDGLLVIIMPKKDSQPVTIQVS